MAEHIYSKGTRVWFEDKDHAWISAEVTTVTKGSDDAIKLFFVDERGKASIVQSHNILSDNHSPSGNCDQYHWTRYQG
jgi:hypothetical protein